MLTPAVPINPAGRGTRIIPILQMESPGHTVLMELVVELEFDSRLSGSGTFFIPPLSLNSRPSLKCNCTSFRLELVPFLASDVRVKLETFDF